MRDTSWIKRSYPDLTFDGYLAVMAGLTGAVSASDDQSLGNATLPASPESRFLAIRLPDASEELLRRTNSLTFLGPGLPPFSDTTGVRR